MESIRELLTRLAHTVDAPDPERAEHLWAAYRAGGPEAEAAFGTLMAWYGQLIYRRVRGFVRSDATDDVFQEVVAHLHRHRRRLPEFAHALRWARAVAVTLSLRALRTERRRRVREHARAVTTAAVLPEQPDDQLDAVRAAVARLPAKEREAVALVFFEGLTRQAAAAAVGIHRDTLAKRIDSALARLRAMLPVGVLVAAGAAAVEGVLATPPVRSDQLAALVTAAWERAESAGASWPPLAWCAGGLTVALGLAVGGVVWWPQTDPPVVVEPPPPRESLQAKNLRILEQEVLPRVVAEIEKLGYTPSDVTWRVDGRVSANGSRVFIPLEPSRKVASAPEKIHLLFCTHQRTLWGHTFEQNRWMKIRPESPLMYDISVPRFGLLELRFPESARRWRAVQEAFERIPREDRTEPEMVRWAFDSGGWTGEEFTIPGAAAWGPVMGNSRDLFAFDGYELYVRRAAGGWRHWRANVVAGQMAVSDTHLYCVLERGIAALPLDDLEAPPERVCDLPASLPRSIAVADGTIYVTTEKPGEWFHRPLKDRKANWTRHEFTTPPLWVAATKGEAFLAHNETLFRRQGRDPNADWLPLVPVPVPSPKLVTWGDRLLAVPQREGEIYARHLTAGSEVGWEAIGRIHHNPE